MFSLSMACQFLVCDGNRQTFKDLSHQIIQTTSLEQDLPQQKSTDNNSQRFPLFPCRVAGLCAFMPETPERNVRLTQLLWDGCEGMSWRKGGREVWGGGYLLSQPVEFLIWAVFGTRVSFFFFGSLFSSSVFVQSFRSHSSEVTFFSWLFLGLTCVRAGPSCTHQKADLSVMTVFTKS